ncbi:uncharacterized protein LOC115752365 isoform X2 [Rhodamnia argentea]|uniref:Uncharacterized protein LOC115752365 isoform X2 n=1 Tax=Rhodamnia argentea TaxID=178133 RepID=A0ABM3GST0_9MYRT|nr:uncharacterized protein LOC115752365 isoform X2 [Rhodamnia argentea]
MKWAESCSSGRISTNSSAASSSSLSGWEEDAEGSYPHSTTAIFPLRTMERHVQTFLNKLSFASVAVATCTLVLLFLRTPQTCLPPTAAARHRFPRSSCDSARREFLPLDKKNKRLWSSRAFRGQVLSYRRFFDSIRDLGLLRNHSKVLCVSAGAGHEVMALSESGVADVTGVELIDSPPLILCKMLSCMIETLRENCDNPGQFCNIRKLCDFCFCAFCSDGFLYAQFRVRVTLV